MSRPRRRAEFGRLGGRAPKSYGPLSIEFLCGEDGAGAMTAMRVEMGPGASHPPVVHRRTAEFFVVLDGSMRATIGGRSRRLRAGDHVRLPPGVPHAFHAGRRGVEVLAVFVPPLSPTRPDIVQGGGR